MDTITKCATNFKRMLETKYKFDVSKKRSIRSLVLDFYKTDFYHLVGFQYLDDIDIDRNPSNTIDVICDDSAITDEILQLSTNYKCKDNDERDIEGRIHELVYLEEYLDTDNIIKIFTMRDIRSGSTLINADYVILSQRPNSSTSSYIFLRKRKESDTYCIVSFFKKGQICYGGEKLYWMMKTKINNNGETVLFKHKNYNPDK